MKNNNIIYHWDDKYYDECNIEDVTHKRGVIHEESH